MKLRIRGNSIRLRLTKSEVERFEATGVVEEIVRFGSDQAAFCYQLLAVADDDPRARFDGKRLTVSMPIDDVRKWTETDLVGLEYEQPIADETTLRILVEKDFKCLTERPGEDDPNAYPNPLASH